MKIYYNPMLKELARNLRNRQTRAEKVLWLELKGHNIFNYDFHRQKPIGNYIYDFYCYTLRLVIEVDGASHENVDVQWNDKDKDYHANSIGFNILRFTNEEVLGNTEKVIGMIKDYISEFEQKGNKITNTTNEKKEIRPWRGSGSCSPSVKTGLGGVCRSTSRQSEGLEDGYEH